MAVFFFIPIYQRMNTEQTSKNIFYVYYTVVTIKLLNNNKFSNIIKNKYCILRVINYLLKIMEDVAAEILQSTIFGAGCYNRKHNIFPFTDVSSRIYFLKRSFG